MNEEIAELKGHHPARLHQLVLYSFFLLPHLFDLPRCLDERFPVFAQVKPKLLKSMLSFTDFRILRFKFVLQLWNFLCRHLPIF